MTKQIEVLDLDSLTILPKETQDKVMYLSQRLPIKEVSHLNPLVQKLIDLQQYRELKYLPDKKKESIASYKAAMRDLRSTNTFIKETKSKIKKPIDEIGKKVLEIESSSLEIVKDIISTLGESFKDYLKEEEEKKRQAALKKEEEERKKFAELEEQNKAQQNVILKSNLINKLKYEITDELNTRVIDASQNFTLSAVKNVLLEVENKTFENAIQNEDISLLSQEELEICRNVFEGKIKNFIIILKNRVDLLETEEKKKQAEIALESKSQSAPISKPVPVIQQAPFTSSASAKEFFEVYLNSLENLQKTIEGGLNGPLKKDQNVLISSEESVYLKKISDINVLLIKTINHVKN